MWCVCGSPRSILIVQLVDRVVFIDHLQVVGVIYPHFQGYIGVGAYPGVEWKPATLTFHTLQGSVTEIVTDAA